MNPERWKQVKDVIGLALDEMPEKRRAVIENLCGADADLRREVESFLEYEAIENGFCEEENLALENLLSGKENSLIGRRVGRYEITGEIGAGGMGTVFAAERADGEFAQKVAVKFLKQSFLTKDARRRFAQERQILAKLKHPFIAQLIDGGAADDGTPFLVMELVEGTPITRYAEAENLSLDEKLDLFKNVCRAVSFAHQNFIVHRDLKPDNILITADGTPKLLDFGIAKLVSEAENAATQTRFQPFTPEYAAPEQIANRTISAASDVYSLGVILYELLTGTKPYKFSSNDSLAAMNSQFESEPPRPSAVGSRRLAVSGERLAVSSERTENTEKYSTDSKGQRTKDKELKTKDKGLNPKSKIQNPKSLRGDLDTILLKSLKKNPLERYASVEKFADDVRRYQAGLPISARPDTFHYRASKFVKRNKIATFAAALIFAALTFGIGIALYQAQIARAERARAEQRFEETRNLAKAVIFNYYDEINKLQGATKVRSMMVTDALAYLDKLAEDESAAQNPELRREIVEGYLRLGDVQGQPYGENLGDTDGAFASYNKALNIFANSPNDENDVAYLKTQATVYQRMSRIMIRREIGGAKSVEYAERAVAVSEKIAALEPTTENKIAAAQSLYNLGWMIGTTNKLETSIPVLQKSLTMIVELRRTEPENVELEKLEGRYNGRIAFHYSMSAQNEMLFWNLAKARTFNETAIPYFEKAVESAKKIAAREPENKTSRRSIFVNESNLAEVLARTGRTDEALNYQREVLGFGLEQLAADASNREMKFEIAEDYLDLAVTFIYRADKKAARENFERGMNLLDELIKADPKNAEFKEFQFSNFTLFYGDAQIVTGDFDGALESYRRASDKSANYAEDAAETKHNRNSLIKMRFGDIHRLKSETEAGAMREKDRRTACNFYRETLETLVETASRYDETREYLDKKIAECK